MSKTRFTKAHHNNSDLRFWTWRDLNRRMEMAKREDAQRAVQFSERAQEVRDQVEFLLGGGLSEGAQTALTAMAEEDMTDFCIMVDLAEPIDIPNVAPLPKITRQHLAIFVDQEPWHSLTIDNDIAVALALLDKIGSQPTNEPWYRYAPEFVNFVVHLLDVVNKEQMLRLVGEYNALAQRDHLQLPEDVVTLMDSMIHQAAQRLGLQHPLLNR